MKRDRQFSISDEDLVKRINDGNQKAMSELYIRYYLHVYNKCFSYVKDKDDASDLTQDVMIKVLEKAGSYSGKSSFSTWLYSVTVNSCLDKIRKCKGKYVTSLDSVSELADYSKSQLNAATENEIKKVYAEQALTSISMEDQQILRMKYLEQKSILELGNVYNLSTSAIKMRLMRARQKAIMAYSISIAKAA